MTDAVVIGGGVVGSSVAMHLADAGLSVIVVERSGGPVEASTRNGGGVRAQCRNRPERLLAMRSQQLWRQLELDNGVDFEYRVSGNARLAYSDAALDKLRAEQLEEHADGLHTEIWTREQLNAQMPFLSPDVLGAKVCPSDGHANPILATWAVIAAAKRCGARYLTDTTAVAIGTVGGMVDSVVVHDSREGCTEIATPLVVHAAGAWSKDLASHVGIDLPLVPSRNAMMITESLPPMFDAFLSSHEKQVYLRQAQKGHVHIGGVFDIPGTFDQSVGVDEMEKLARAVELVPALKQARILRTWAGTLDYTPDHLPLVGPVVGLGGYVVAAGFSGHGFCLGPVVGEAVADLVLDRPPHVDLSALSPSRLEIAA
ncbi:NAD(P)/FAD-dependent oxidoreductase [Mycobacterium sp. MS1601]|uniref:NAD(P)/FAD-dependent oxidoreductase n=1 Tax=Mycobacterium sp. MS1601 TaxID=1936029 RepID=UPI0009F9746A|nr:FAD-binding oxidoreductase [Mycobacterium sp. MS1601]